MNESTVRFYLSYQRDLDNSIRLHERLQVEHRREAGVLREQLETPI